MSHQKLNNALKQLKETPGSTSVQVLVGQAYLEKKNYYEAREHFKKALKIDKKNVQAYIGLGKSYRNRDQSLKYLIDAVEIDPNNAEALLLTGRFYRRFKNDRKAIEYLDKSLKIEPNNATAWIDLGICYFYADNINNAIGCMKKAIEIDPKMDHAFANLCRYYGDKEELLKAIQFGEKAIELNNDNAYSHFNLSFVYSKLGDFKKTILSLEKTVTIVPHHKQAYYQLGNVYLATGEYSKAQKAFESALKIDQYLEQAHRGLAMVYMDLGQPEEALKEFRQASFRDIKQSLPDETYALEAGKRNIANRRYLHIKSLRNMGIYFDMLPQHEAKDLANCLYALYDALVQNKIEIRTIKSNEARNIIGRLYQLITDKHAKLHENRKRLLELKGLVGKKKTSEHSFLRMLALQWDEVERQLQKYIPVFPKLRLEILSAENIIYHEKGNIHFKIENDGLLPAHNVSIEVQLSNEFSVSKRNFTLKELQDETVCPFELSVLTEGSFSISLQLDYDEGETEVLTFRLQAYRKNPYYYGKPVKDAEMFFGREALIDSILSRIKNVAKQDILVHGIRRIGKSSLLYQIKNRLQLPLIPIYFSLQQIGKVDSLTVLRQLMFEMTDAFCNSLPQTKSAVDNICLSSKMVEFNNGAPFDMVSRAFRKDLEALMSYSSKIAPGIRFIILLDEGDLLFRIGIEMQRFLRDLLQRFDQVVMVVAGSPKIVELSAGDYDSPFYNNFAHENLTGLSLSEAQQLICDPLEVLGISCSKTIAKNIYNFCGGVTYYIQAICFHMLNIVYDQNFAECTSGALKESQEKVFEELKKSFKAIWLEFSESEQELLKFLALSGESITLSSPEIKNKIALVPGLSEYEIIHVADNNICIRAGLIKRWIKSICKYES